MVKNLKQARAGRSETQEATAKAIGLSPSGYAKKERGDNAFLDTEIAALAGHFELSPAEVWEIFFASKVRANGTLQ